MNILEGMTREQALACVCELENKTAVFAYRGRAYLAPWASVDESNLYPSTAFQLRKEINAYFDAQEASRWVEPTQTIITEYEGGHIERFYDGAGYKAEISRTNARREIEAFIAANSPGDVYAFYEEDGDLYWTSGNLKVIGALTCGSQECAQEVIRRFPAQLRLLAGVK